jgi:hypothetical protein
MNTPTMTNSKRPPNALITSNYACIYLKAPNLLSWAGLAAYVSNQIGILIQLSDRAPRRSRKISIANSKFNHGIIDDLEILKEGNSAIYSDVYWALDLLIKNPSILEKRLEASQYPSLYKSTFKLFLSSLKERDPKKKVNLVQEANYTLTKYEQLHIIQPFFSRLSHEGKRIISLLTHIDFDSSPLSINWVRLRSFYFHFLIYHPCKILKKGWPDIIKPEFRWEWIEHSLYPNWLKLHEEETDVKRDMLILCSSKS